MPSERGFVYLENRSFCQVKGMIQEMIEKLVADAQKEASHKAPASTSPFVLAKS